MVDVEQVASQSAGQSRRCSDTSDKVPVSARETRSMRFGHRDVGASPGHTFDDGIASGDSGPEHAQIPASPSVGHHRVDDAGSVGHHRQFVAGVARLADFEQNVAPLPAITDADGGLIDPRDGQILAKGTGSKGRIRIQLPCQRGRCSTG